MKASETLNVLLDKFRDMGEGLSHFTERWAPDSWVVRVMLTAIALLLATLDAGVGPLEATEAWAGCKRGPTGSGGGDDDANFGGRPHVRGDVGCLAMTAAAREDERSAQPGFKGMVTASPAALSIPWMAS